MPDRERFLTTDKVNEIMDYCLLLGPDTGEETLIVEGIVQKFIFLSSKLSERENEIIDMLTCLPEEFFQNKGGGWSFLNMCNDDAGNQWTDFHMIMEGLVGLGIAIGKVRYTLPKEMWSMFPGQMPYIVVLLDK